MLPNPENYRKPENKPWFFTQFTFLRCLRAPLCCYSSSQNGRGSAGRWQTPSCSWSTLELLRVILATRKVTDANGLCFTLVHETKQWSFQARPWRKTEFTRSCLKPSGSWRLTRREGAARDVVGFSVFICFTSQGLEFSQPGWSYRSDMFYLPKTQCSYMLHTGRGFR